LKVIQVERLTFKVNVILLPVNDYFQFRQFRVGHRRSSMKVGTDAVLLGAWVNVNGVESILDAGTGTGVIALMMAQRTNGKAIIDAVEIDPEAAADAAENFSHSPWSASLHLLQQSLHHLVPQHPYDLIISNPPYFINSLKPPLPSRQTARHAGEMTFDMLITAATRHLKQPSGRLALILPVAESIVFHTKAEANGFNLSRRCDFQTRPHKPVERVLMEFAFRKVSLLTEELCLYNQGNEWTMTYHELTKPFYLKD
jgi:tRNA1Val (adenine37-N6)-methyltransferase